MLFPVSIICSSLLQSSIPWSGCITVGLSICPGPVLRVSWEFVKGFLLDHFFSDLPLPIQACYGESTPGRVGGAWVPGGGAPVP